MTVNVENAIQMFAREAGHHALRIQGQLEDVRSKDGQEIIASNILTEADEFVGRLAEDLFTRMFPGSLVIQEETVDRFCPDSINDDSLVFVVDPIDGTLFYAARSFAWTVSIGVFHRWTPIAGCVYAPALGDMYYTQGDVALLNGKEIRAGVRLDALKGSILLKHIKDYYSVRAFPGYTLAYGSIALHLALVASGFACACVASKHKVYDVAGGAKILSNAGAEMRYLNGEVPDWGELLRHPAERAPDYFFACPEGQFDELAKYVDRG
jgi:myo-inositol-1(or 4)-monophosphatase